MPPRNIFAIFVATALSCIAGIAVNADPIIELPGTGSVSRDTVVELPTENTVVAAQFKEVKSSKTVEAEQEETNPWHIAFKGGYESTYMFRGTDLTPNADGLEYQQLTISNRGFTLGAWFGVQAGTARVLNATTIGEAGGGPSSFGFVGGGVAGHDLAQQDKFTEVDLFLTYTHSFGWVDLSGGNIFFRIKRAAEDRFIVGIDIPPLITFEDDFDVPLYEWYDRLFISLSSSKLQVGPTRIVPSITYYQTVLNEHSRPKDTLGLSEEVYNLEVLGIKWNDTLGGYAEGKIQTITPFWDNRVRIESTSLVSYSAGDRVKPVDVPPALAGMVSSIKPLYGFNHYQSGAQLILQITRCLSVTGFGNYAYHISPPTTGTHREEYWGGGEVGVSF
jgi:hypothetical protein